MLSGVDALVALQRFGTVSEAGVRLGLTQSAVSKRIQALQDTLGYRLVEPEGRRLRLTAQAVDFLEHAGPLVAELRGLRAPSRSDAISHFSLALADSIASSWGPKVLRRALDKLTGVAVDLHSHRSVLVVESVRLGRYHLGLCTDPLGAMDLIHHAIVDEPIVLVTMGAGTGGGKSPLITIEPSSAAWKVIEPLVRARHPRLLQRELVPVESFGAALQMVRARFGDGLIPLGLALEAGLARGSYRELSGIVRPVSLLTRKTVHQLTSFRLLQERLQREATAYFADARK
jgi:DNA-binding transcriptional LysR family regulator